MPAKMIVDRRRTARKLGKSVRELIHEATPALVSRLTPNLRDGETMPDVGFLFELVARRLEDTSDFVTSKHESLKERLDRDVTVRQVRDQAAVAVREALVKIRRAVDGAFGKKVATSVLGYDGNTGQQPEELLLKARRVLARLADGSFNLPIPELPGILLDTSEWPGLLVGPAAELEQALEELSEGGSKAESRSVGKRVSVADFDRLHQCTARLLQDVLKYADERDLAASVRLAYRKAGTADEELPTPAPGEGPASPTAPTSQPPASS